MQTTVVSKSYSSILIVLLSAVATNMGAYMHCMVLTPHV